MAIPSAKQRTIMNYKKRLFFYFLLVFAVFTIAVISFEQLRDTEYRAAMLSSTLKAYSYTAETDPESEVLSSEMRVTKISADGTVLYDNDVENENNMENHYERPEVLGARQSGEGYDIRKSATTGQSYFYFARAIPDGYIRVALPYLGDTRSLLSPDINFVVFVIVLFIVAMIFLWVIARSFGHDLQNLKDNLTEEVRARAKLKAEMTSAIAHELRTPTSAIRSYAETLCEDDISEEYRERFIRRIHSASLRLSELLENVSLLTNIEEAPSKFNKESVNVAKIGRDVLDEFSYLAEKNLLQLECVMPSEVNVWGSKTLIYSIWRNLLENAIKYGGKGVRVVLSLDDETSSHYYFSVSDNGEGLDDEYLPRLFERFFRVDSGRTRDTGGSGLGLSIVAHGVKFHRGEVEALRSPQGGLRVSFSLSKTLS